jgi:predicted transglutaminase-like cysteine proteinase
VRAISICAAVLAAALCLVGEANAAQAGQAFSGYAEVALRTGPNFPKWQLVRERLSKEAAAVGHCMEQQPCSSPVAAELADELREFASEPPLEQAKAVHWLVNTRPYREDQQQFGRSDVWQNPFSFWRQGGDCEDFAIAKYMALRALGFADSQLRLTIVSGRAARDVHAVLLIDVSGEWYVADNLLYSLRRLSRYDDWKPIFSVSDAGAWRYVPRPLAQEAARPQPAGDPEPAARTAAITLPSRERL